MKWVYDVNIEHWRNTSRNQENIDYLLILWNLTKVAAVDDFFVIKNKEKLPSSFKGSSNTTHKGSKKKDLLE